MFRNHSFQWYYGKRADKSGAPAGATQWYLGFFIKSFLKIVFKLFIWKNYCRCRYWFHGPRIFLWPHLKNRFRGPGIFLWPPPWKIDFVAGGNFSLTPPLKSWFRGPGIFLWPPWKIDFVAREFFFDPSWKIDFVYNTGHGSGEVYEKFPIRATVQGSLRKFPFQNFKLL